MAANGGPKETRCAAHKEYTPAKFQNPVSLASHKAWSERKRRREANERYRDRKKAKQESGGEPPTFGGDAA